jgi:diguanylate cyclase
VHVNETAEDIRRIADSAFSLIRDKGYRPTPKNYTLWFAYFAKVDPDLTRILDAVLADGQDFSEQRALALYSQFFEIDMEAEALRQSSALIEASVSKVLENLAKADKDASRYGEALQDYSGRLVPGLDEATVRRIVDGVVDETQKMRARNQAIVGDIKRSSAEIEELRRTVENVRREAHTDSLTGIANRRSFDENLAAAIRQAAEQDTTLGLLMVDIDHFKGFNDNFGHQVGDKVLQLVARILKQSVKGRDTVARYGGEEFAVVLPNTPLPGSAALAEQIRTAVASRRIVHKGSGEDFGVITLSVGVATLHKGETRDALIGRADRALYAAKTQGRNRVVTEDQIETCAAG